MVWSSINTGGVILTPQFLLWTQFRNQKPIRIWSVGGTLPIKNNSTCGSFVWSDGSPACPMEYTNWAEASDGADNCVEWLWEKNSRLPVERQKMHQETTFHLQSDALYSHGKRGARLNQCGIINRDFIWFDFNIIWEIIIIIHLS